MQLQIEISLASPGLIAEFKVQLQCQVQFLLKYKLKGDKKKP